MQKIQYFCDICEKECIPQEGLGTFTGFIVKMNTELVPQRVGFDKHYCSECVEKILDFIKDLNPKEV